MSRTERKIPLIVTVLVTGLSLLLLIVIESGFSIFYYQKNRPANSSPLSTVAFLNELVTPAPTKQVTKTSVTTPKFEHVLGLRDSGVDAFPSYLYEPQMHDPSGFYHLANVADRRIVNCDENGFFNEWDSDEIGFRNPKNQLGSDIDFIFIGDSSTEGNCENEEGTFAGLMRERGKSVLNLGRGGTGPLFQLGTLVEYAEPYNSRDVVWIIMTANDLKNLREEKTTRLQRYLDDTYDQGLSSRRAEVSEELTDFLTTSINANRWRKDHDVAFVQNDGYGESLDELEAREFEVQLLERVAKRILAVTSEKNRNLRIVLLNHPYYMLSVSARSWKGNNNQTIQDLTSRTMRKFAEENGVNYLEFSREFLAEHERYYTPARIHFNATGYRKVGTMMLHWLEDPDAASKTY